jgi:hypothetical protein
MKFFTLDIQLKANSERLIAQQRCFEQKRKHFSRFPITAHENTNKLE